MPSPIDTGPTSVQRQARALGDPTRHAIFRHVAAAGEPVRVAGLAKHFGLNHNAVRQHLAKLCDAGLLIEDQAPRSGPGRPALQYRSSPEAASAWDTLGAYSQLAVMLAEAISSGRSPREVGAETGRRVASADRADAVDELQAEMARRGFHPRRVDGTSSIELVLQRCAFQVVALANPEVVCQLHLGLAEGITDALGGDVEVAGLVAENAEQANCRLEVRRREEGPVPR